MNIEEEALTYLQSDKTIKEVSIDLGISKRTLQLHIKKLQELNPNLYTLVLNKQKSNIIAGRIKGGENGKRPPSYTKEEANLLADLMIRNQLTYEEASLETGVPSSTIHDMVHSDFMESEKLHQLELIAMANKKGLSTEKFIESKRSL